MPPQGKGVVCTLHEGDDFGKLSLLTEGERSASISTREYNCFFLKIERDDFRRILMSVESSTMKVTDRGREVMHLQREGVGRSVSHHPLRGLGCYCYILHIPHSYTVVRGTPVRMLDHLISSDIDISLDNSFAYDFFLTHPAFMSMNDLCTGLLTRYRHRKPEEGEEEEGEVCLVMTIIIVVIYHESFQEVGKTRKKRIAQAVAVWINVAKLQVVKDAGKECFIFIAMVTVACLSSLCAVFLGLLKELQDGLELDGLTEEMQALDSVLSDSIRSAILGKHTHSPVLSRVW